MDAWCPLWAYGLICENEEESKISTNRHHRHRPRAQILASAFRMQAIAMVMNGPLVYSIDTFICSERHFPQSTIVALYWSFSTYELAVIHFFHVLSTHMMRLISNRKQWAQKVLFSLCKFLISLPQQEWDDEHNSATQRSINRRCRASTTHTRNTRKSTSERSCLSITLGCANCSVVKFRRQCSSQRQHEQTTWQDIPFQMLTKNFDPRGKWVFVDMPYFSRDLSKQTNNHLPVTAHHIAREVNETTGENKNRKETEKQ